jgi:predicted DNA-binding transcriptional regulator YafY
VQQLPRKVKQEFRDLSKVISFQPLTVSPLAVKTAIYQSIVDALKNRQAILIDYDSLTEWKRIATTLRPYRLAFIKHSWYVIGHSSMHREVLTFNIMRIESLKMLRQQ